MKDRNWIWFKAQVYSRVGWTERSSFEGHGHSTTRLKRDVRNWGKPVVVWMRNVPYKLRSLHTRFLVGKLIKPLRGRTMLWRNIQMGLGFEGLQSGSTFCTHEMWSTTPAATCLPLHMNSLCGIVRQNKCFILQCSWSLSHHSNRKVTNT